MARQLLTHYIYIYMLYRPRNKIHYTRPYIYIYIYIYPSVTNIIHVRVVPSFQQPMFQKLQMGMDIQMHCMFETCSCWFTFQVKV